MFRRIISWLTGKKGGEHFRSDQPAGHTAGPRGHGPSAAVVAGQDGAASPVFSSRAVRDAAVVTGVIDAIRRYNNGEDGAEPVVHKLEALSAEQTSFLKISVAPDLLATATRIAGEHNTASGAALRRLLVTLQQDGFPRDNGQEAESTPPSPPPIAATDTGHDDGPPPPASPRTGTPLFTTLRPPPRGDGDGAVPADAARTIPTPTTRVPGALPQQRMMPAGTATSASRGIPPRPATLVAAQPAPDADAAPHGTAPHDMTLEAGDDDLTPQIVIPALAVTRTATAVDLPEPPPPPKAAPTAPKLHRLSREAATERRARLLASHSDDLP